jgi:hypothetical protein
MTVPSRFGVLRLIANLLKILAWVTLILAILGALGVGLLGAVVRQGLADEALLTFLLLIGDGAGLILALGLGFSGLMTFLGLYAGAESILVQLAIEENSRMTAALLLRLEERENPSTPPGSSPYETYYGNE